jgi:hypothetical protein
MTRRKIAGSGLTNFFCTKLQNSCRTPNFQKKLQRIKDLSHPVHSYGRMMSNPSEEKPRNPCISLFQRPKLPTNLASTTDNTAKENMLPKHPMDPGPSQADFAGGSAR